MAEMVPDRWKPVLDPVLATAEARKLGGWLRAQEDAGKTIYPPRGCRLQHVRVGAAPLPPAAHEAGHVPGPSGVGSRQPRAGRTGHIRSGTGAAGLMVTQ